ANSSIAEFPCVQTSIGRRRQQRAPDSAAAPCRRAAAPLERAVAVHRSQGHRHLRRFRVLRECRRAMSTTGLMPRPACGVIVLSLQAALGTIAFVAAVLLAFP